MPIRKITQAAKPFFCSILLVLLASVAAEACPTCKQAVAENGGDTVTGFFWSICFMMAMPFTIFFVVSMLMFSQFRKAGRIENRYSPEIAAKLGIPTAPSRG